MKKTGLAIFLAVLAAFVVILAVTGIVGNQLGKAGENIALGVVAVVLIIALVRMRGDK